MIKQRGLGASELMQSWESKSVSKKWGKYQSVPPLGVVIKSSRMAFLSWETNAIKIGWYLTFFQALLIFMNMC